MKIKTEIAVQAAMEALKSAQRAKQRVREYGIQESMKPKFFGLVRGMTREQAEMEHPEGQYSHVCGHQEMLAKEIIEFAPHCPEYIKLDKDQRYFLRAFVSKININKKD